MSIGFMFHSTWLRQRYIDALKAAVVKTHIGIDEMAWLLSPIRAAAVGAQDPVRVDRLTLNDGTDRPFELAAMLLFSHALASDQPVYLYSLTHGVEAFESRHGLLAALQARFTTDNANVIFEASQITGDPFHAQMLAILDQQVDHLQQLSGQLQQTPTLQAAVTASLAGQLREHLPHLSVNPQRHLLQIVGQTSGDIEAVPVTQTLTQASFDDYCKIRIEDGFTRRFLDARGLPVNAADERLLKQAFADATPGTRAHYQRLLAGFWRGIWRDKRTRRDLAIEALRDGLRRAIYGGSTGTTLAANALLRLQALLSDPPQTPTPSCQRIAIRIGYSNAYSLAATFVVAPDAGGDGPWLWFSPEHTLMAFSDTAAMAAHFGSTQGRRQLRTALALEDRQFLLQQGAVQLELQPITSGVFADRVDSILALQLRNLEYATGLPDSPTEVAAMIDDALDIRQLIDPRLLQVSAGRWRSEAPVDFDAVWRKTGASPDGAGEENGAHEKSRNDERLMVLSASWRSLANDFDVRAQQLELSAPVLLECAEQALQPWLGVLCAEVVSLSQVTVRWSDPVAENESTGQSGRDLSSVLLDYVSGHRSQGLPANAQVTFGSAAAGGSIGVELVNHVLMRVAEGFADQYVQAFKTISRGYLRQGDRHVHLYSEALSLREDAMRLNLSLGSRQGTITGPAMDVIRQLLDRPVRSLRLAPGAAVTEAFTVSIAFAGQPAILLCDTMVLYQPGSPDSPLLLWQGRLGWLQFPSARTLQVTLQDELGNRPDRWIAALGERDARVLRRHITKTADSTVQVILERIDGHAVEALHDGVLARKCEDLLALFRRAVRCRAEAGLFKRLAVQSERDTQLRAMLDQLALRVEDSIFVALQPSWLKSASVPDLALCYRVFTRYYLATEAGKDFSFGVPALKAFTRKRLLARMALDFPGEDLDPDHITVLSRRYVVAVPPLGMVPASEAAATIEHRESLVDYAINRFADTPQATLIVESSDHPDASGLLNGDYVKRLVRELDVGTGYLRLLRQAFAPDGKDYAMREQLFIQQTPSALLAVALPEKLSGRLSAQGYEFLARVMDTPQAVGRAPVNGTRVVLSPLQLVASAGMSADPVSGLYLICAADARPGPVVLYALYNRDFVLREFASQQALLEALRTERSLQQLVLSRVDSEVRSRYDHGGFTEPHLPFSAEGFMEVPLERPGPVALKISEVPGNALEYLFRGTVKMLLDIGVSNVVTNSQAEHSTRAFLASLGIEQALALLPGKWAALVSLWQSHTLLRASAADVSERRWGKALSEFCAALGVMTAAREQAIAGLSSADSLEDVPLAVDADREAVPLDFSWRGASLSAEQQVRLQALEARQVTLQTLEHDALLSLYVDKRTGTPYAMVAKRLYQVRNIPDEGKWIVVGSDGATGPQLMLDSEQQWQFDLGLRLRGGGGAVSALKTSAVTVTAEQELVIEASGMAEIRACYRHRAGKIVQAHSQARLYLENCLDNFSLRDDSGELDSEVTTIIGHFFGTRAPDPALLRQVEDSVRRLLDEVTDPSLSPFSSTRYVVGTNRPGNERTAAFVIPADPQRRVFLTERFFRTPVYRLESQADLEGFDLEAHARAATLIHELSHLVLDTKDLAYIESEAPFPDLLRTNTVANSRIREQIIRLHERRLSHLTPRDELFTLFEDGRWRDLAREDARGYATVLRITGTKTLSEARAVFLADAEKRSRVMLKNADSVTLLILRLGRLNRVRPTHDEVGAQIQSE
jgi:hypothetical protein